MSPGGGLGKGPALDSLPACGISTSSCGAGSIGRVIVQGGVGPEPDPGEVPLSR